jgi:hypothetical protein
MRLPTSRTVRARAVMGYKFAAGSRTVALEIHIPLSRCSDPCVDRDAFEFDLEDVTFTKEKRVDVSTSPVSIVAELSATRPPKMKPLPAPVVAPTPSDDAMIPLPPATVWGHRHKIWIARCKDRRMIEDMIKAHESSDVALEQRACLPVKTSHLERKAERRLKARNRGLMSKHYDKRRKARLASRKDRDDRLAAEQENEAKQEKKERAAWRPALDDEVRAEVEEPEPKARPSRKTAERREKVRRSQRRAARDAKCLVPDDPIEWAALEVPPPKKPKRREGPPLLPPKLVRYLLSRESSGAALRDVFHGGVCLSSAAAHDFQAMWLQMCLPIVACRWAAECSQRTPPRPPALALEAFRSLFARAPK